MGNLDPPNIRPQRGIGPRPDKPEPGPPPPRKTKATLMVKSESNREEEKEESFKYDPVWNSITHIPISLGAKRWSLMSVALAVIGVTVFVCLTLRKRGLRQAGCRESGGAEGRGDRERECLRPSQLGYGTAARTNP